MDSFDALTVVLAIIAVLSGLFFVLAILADIVLPLLAERKPRPQASYRSRKA
jgi:hypothetical protein